MVSIVPKSIIYTEFHNFISNVISSACQNKCVAVIIPKIWTFNTFRTTEDKDVFSGQTKVWKSCSIKKK